MSKTISAPQDGFSRSTALIVTIGADAFGLPILPQITVGQAHDGRSAQDMLGLLGRHDVLLAGRAYDADTLRLERATRGAWANVKLMPNRVNLPPYNKRLCRQRNRCRALLQ